MPLYDYRCPKCGPVEQFSLVDFRNDQKCETCGSALELIPFPQPKHDYTPFHPYFDEGLGVEVTGRDQRRRVMNGLHVDFRDHPSKGDESARRDKCEAMRKSRNLTRRQQ